MESVLKYIVVVIFALAVLGKLTGKTKSTFEKSGYSSLFMYGIALAEVILTIGLFTPYDLYAVIGLIAIVGGAIFTLYRQKLPATKYLLALVSMVLLLVLLGQKLNY